MLHRSTAARTVTVLGLVLTAGTQMGVGCEDPTHYVTMRDGVTLATDVYEGARPAPTILMRTPYDKDGLASTASVFVSLGYSAVAQDLRGTYASGGTFMMFYDDGWGANQDGYDTVEWASAGTWNEGGTCIYGGSALAISGLAAAGATPPSLKCMFSLVGTGDLYHHAAYQGGALLENLLVGWLSGLGHQEALDTALASPLETDAIWQPTYMPDNYEGIDVPIYHMGGWYDIFTQGTIDGFTGIEAHGGPRAAGYQKMVIGPWTHGGTSGELTYPDSAVPGGEELRWFERWLKGTENGVDTEPPVKVYLMGDPASGAGVANRWVELASWPPASTPTRYYLGAGGSLSTARPVSGVAPLSYDYDPADPVPTVGGNNLLIAAGPMDQRSVLDRDDVLLFETGALAEPVVVAGPLTVHLSVATSAVDTDFTAKLLDIYPDGRAMNVMDGVLRLRFRDGQDHEVLATPGAVYGIDIDLWSTALAFEAGHRIAVAISSSNAPRFDVNPNTGAWAHEGGPSITATQTVYLDASRPSWLELPVTSGL